MDFGLIFILILLILDFGQIFILILQTMDFGQIFILILYTIDFGLIFILISEFRVSETARSLARIRDKNNFSPHEHTSGKEVSVEFP